MAAKHRTISFAFSIAERTGSYETQNRIAVSISDETIPEGRDHVDYLRERVTEELDRKTLASAARTPQAALVQLDPPTEETEED